ncbi:MAG: MarR family transcriptional regulator [Chloroflexota bacterium]
MERLQLPVNYGYLVRLVGHLSGLSHLRATQLFTEALDEIKLTPKQAIALEFIAHNPTDSQKEIANHIGTTPTVMVGVLDALTRQGLVERVRSNIDRRRHSVKLTETGEAIRQKIKDAAFFVEEQLFAESNLSAEEWEHLIHLMRKLTNREDEISD